MSRPRVAIVSRDPETRFRAAQAFDDAPRDWHVVLFDSTPEGADAVVVAPDVDEPGIALDLDDPPRTLRAVRERLAETAVGTVVVVGSASGGVGCTSIALHLAAALSREEPAIYVEGTARCGGRLRLNLEAEGPHWGDVAGVDTVDGSSIPIRGGFRALLAPGNEDVMPDSVVDACRRRTSHVVIDAGVLDNSARVSVQDSLGLLVLCPSVPAARRAAALCADDKAPFLLISNRLGPGSELTQGMLVQILGRPVTLALPCSPLLRDAEDEGRVLGANEGAWSRRIARLAGCIRG